MPPRALKPLKIGPVTLGKKERPVILLTTTPDMVGAEKLAFLLVENRLAACVNILPEVQSIYHWEGKLARERECKLLIKTSSGIAGAARDFIKANHPYKVPEITTIGDKGDVTMHVDYWAWLTGYVSGTK